MNIFVVFYCDYNIFLYFCKVNTNANPSNKQLKH